jgi:RNA recognition motif-containing protein
MNNFISSFQFQSKTLIAAAIVSVAGLIVMLMIDGSNMSFLLGVLFMMIASTYTPSPSANSKPATTRPVSTTTTSADEDVKTVFVGNLAFRASKRDLGELFQQYGTVHSVRLMTDRATRKPRGFGFVEMDPAGAAAAISNLDEHEFHGRQIRVNEANERKPRDAE